MKQLVQFRWPKRFYFVGAILLVELMTHAANAASYEVVPSFTPRMASSAAVMRYNANIFDHAHGKAYSCWVDRTLEPAASLSYRCHDLAKEHTSLLPPSSDITTAVNSSGRPNTRVAPEGCGKSIPILGIFSSVWPMKEATHTFLPTIASKSTGGVLLRHRRLRLIRGRHRPHIRSTCPTILVRSSARTVETVARSRTAPRRRPAMLR